MSNTITFINSTQNYVVQTNDYALACADYFKKSLRNSQFLALNVNVKKQLKIYKSLKFLLNLLKLNYRIEQKSNNIKRIIITLTNENISTKIYIFRILRFVIRYNKLLDFKSYVERHKLNNKYKPFVIILMYTVRVINNHEFKKCVAANTLFSSNTDNNFYKIKRELINVKSFKDLNKITNSKPHSKRFRVSKTLNSYTVKSIVKTKKHIDFEKLVIREMFD